MDCLGIVCLRGAFTIAKTVFCNILDQLDFRTRQKSASQHLCDAITLFLDSLREDDEELEPNDLNIELSLVGILIFFIKKFFALVLGLSYFFLLAIFVGIASAISFFIDVIVLLKRSVERAPEPAINFEDLPGYQRSGSILLLLLIMFSTYSYRSGSTNRKLGEHCQSDANCMSGLSCCNWDWCTSQKCIQTKVADPFETIDTSMPFNRYAFLTTHNSFLKTGGAPWTLYNQEDSVADQLNNGVRALMLDVYDFKDDIWLCHSFGETCYDLTAFKPARDTLRQLDVFLQTNPSAIVTLILEDHVSSHQGLTKLFNETGLEKYWFPVQYMPQNGEDWPIVSDMIKHNYRLLVFTSNRSKESTEGIAYQWTYMVENQYGDGGMNPNACNNRSESSFLGDRTKSLVFVNYFSTKPSPKTACKEHSRGLVGVLNKCYAVADNRWANFLAVDYYKRSDGGGVFQATDMLNGKLICGRDDVRASRKGILKHAFNDLLRMLGLTWKGSEHGLEKVARSDRDQILSVMSAEGKKEDPKFNLKEENNLELNLGDDEFREF